MQYFRIQSNLQWQLSILALKMPFLSKQLLNSISSYILYLKIHAMDGRK